MAIENLIVMESDLCGDKITLSHEQEKVTLGLDGQKPVDLSTNKWADQAAYLDELGDMLQLAAEFCRASYAAEELKKGLTEAKASQPKATH